MRWDIHNTMKTDKQCNRCRRNLPKTAFGINRAEPDGLHRTCKECLRTERRRRAIAAGRVDRLLSEDEVRAAVVDPPEDTRAYFRGQCLRRYPLEVAAASWDSVIFDVGRESLQRVPTLEPLRGTKAHVGDLLERCDTAAELVEVLTGR